MMRRCAALLAGVLVVAGLIATPAQAVPVDSVWSAFSRVAFLKQVNTAFGLGGSTPNIYFPDTSVYANGKFVGRNRVESLVATSGASSITPPFPRRESKVTLSYTAVGDPANPVSFGTVSGGSASSGGTIRLENLTGNVEAHSPGLNDLPVGKPLGATQMAVTGTSWNYSNNFSNLLTTGAAAATSRVEPYSVGNGGFGLRSTVTASMDNAQILGGPDNGGLRIDIPEFTITQSASGTGNPTATFAGPAVQVTTPTGTETLANGTSSKLYTLTTTSPAQTWQVLIWVPNPTPFTSGGFKPFDYGRVTVLVRTGSAAQGPQFALLPVIFDNFGPTGALEPPAAAPAAPTLTGPPNNSVQNGRPTFTGTGVAGAKINLTIDGTVRTDVTTVAADGTWSYQPSTAISPDGSHTVTATQTTAGGTSPASNALTITTDTVRPVVPTIASPADGATTSDRRPTVTGTGEPGAYVDLLLDGRYAGQTRVAADGTYSVRPDNNFPDGPNVISVRSFDAANNFSAASPTRTVVVDATAPAVPVVTSPAAGAALADTTPTLTGTAEPGSRVEVYVDGTSRGTVTADATTGAWSLLSPALSQGSHTVSATATDAAGNTSARSTDTGFVVDTSAPAAPVISAPAEGSTTSNRTPAISGTAEPNATVSVQLSGRTAVNVTADGSGNWTTTPAAALADGPYTVTAIQTDRAANASPAATSAFSVDGTAPAAPVIEGPTQNSRVRGPDVTVTGTGEPGARLVLTPAGGTASAPVAVAANGTWEVVLTGLPDGPASVSAVQTDRAGNASPTSPARAFTVSSTGPEPPVITAPASGSSTTNRRPALSGTTLAGSRVTVELDNGTTLGPVTATGGAWSVTPTADLPDGPYTATATLVDGNGDTSAASEPVTFTVDATAPTALTITTPADGSRSNQNKPPVAGRGEPGATVRVLLDGNPIGTPVVAGNGLWSLPDLATALIDGSHTLTATQTDAAGNVSPLARSTFVVDTTAPTDLTVTAPVAGSRTNDTTPTFRGAGEPGARVEVVIGGRTVATATVAADRTWSADVSPALSAGPQLAEVRQTDVAGNVSDPVEVPFTIDVTAPDAPEIDEPAAGAVLTDRTPAITGTAEPGSDVRVSVGGQNLGPVRASGAGNWSLTVPTALADGPYTASATATDAAGNVSPAAIRAFRIDATAPAAPVINVPVANATTTDPTPTISGTAEPGSVVRVFVDGADVGTATAGTGGAWSLESSLSLADGPHTATATATDSAGNTSAPSAGRPFRVDTTAPDVPDITSPAGGSTTGTTPTVRGTAEPGSAVDVYIDNAVVGSTRAGSDGTFALPLTTPLSQGRHVAEAVAIDAVGNRSPRSIDVPFTVDTVAPAAPVVTAPANGSTTASPTPPISGAAEPGAQVEVTLDGAVIGTATADATGAWSLLAPRLTEGAHTASAVAVDAGGNRSPRSTAVRFTVDLTAPAAPTIATPTAGQVLNDPTPTVTGRGEPGATVAVSIDGTPVGETTVGSTGIWSLPLTNALDDGPHEATAVQTDPVGNASPPSASRAFSVDTERPAAPEIEAPSQDALVAGPNVTVTGTGESGAAVTVSRAGTTYGPFAVGTDGTWSGVLTGLPDGPTTVTATQTDPAGNVSPASPERDFVVDSTAPVAPVISSPARDAVLTVARPPVSGTGVPGSTVSVKVDGIAVGTAVVGADGSWRLTPGSPLSDGPHVATAVQVDRLGRSSAESVPVDFSTDTTAPVAPEIARPADGSVTANPTPEIAGTGEPGAQVVATLDGVALPAVTVAGNGSWRVGVPTALDDGPHTVSAVQTDLAGRASPASPTTTFTVDTGAPEPPRITAPVSGSTTRDATPTIRGTGVIGNRVTVSVDGTPIGTTVVGTDGTWSLTPDEALADGLHAIAAIQTDGVGNASEPAEVDLVVDTTAPAPRIFYPVDGQGVRADTFISGRAEEGSTVTVRLDGKPIGEAFTGVDGSWTLFPDAPLPKGTHTLTATATDAVGNTSPRSPEVEIQVGIIDPVIVSPAEDAVVLPTPTIAGTGQPGASIQLEVVTADASAKAAKIPAGRSSRAARVPDPGDFLGETEVGSNGRWSLKVAEPLDPGRYRIQANQQAAIGDFPETAVSNIRAFRVVAAAAVPVITSPTQGDSVSSPVQVCGTGQPGATIRLRDADGVVLATLRVGTNGRWCADVDLSAGEVSVSATQTTSDGTVTLSAVRTFTVAEEPGSGGPGGSGSGGSDGSGGGLASTGGPGLGIALLGLVSTGLAVALLRRQRRPGSAPATRADTRAT